jgi:hypothetical protein
MKAPEFTVDTYVKTTGEDFKRPSLCHVTEASNLTNLPSARLK